jgi:hypothetical protein
VIRGRHDWSPLAPTPSFRGRDKVFYSESRVGFGGKAHPAPASSAKHRLCEL